MQVIGGIIFLSISNHKKPFPICPCYKDSEGKEEEGIEQKNVVSVTTGVVINVQR